jgi:uncharacterized membrane protein
MLSFGINVLDYLLDLMGLCISSIACVWAYIHVLIFGINFLGYLLGSIDLHISSIACVWGLIF